MGAAPLPGQNTLPAKAAQTPSPAKAARLAAAREKREEEGPNYLRERSEYFTRQRAYPHRHIPQGARLRALEQMRAMRKNPEPAVAGVWESLGPLAIAPAQGAVFGGSPSDSGRVTALAVDPTNADTVYLGAAEGGVWKTTNGGSHWTPLTDSQPSLAVGSIAIDPTNAQTIYVGTGEANFNGDGYYGAGILKSTDGGNTWTQLGGTYFGVCSAGSDLASQNAGSYVGGLAVDPGNNQVVLAAATDCPNQQYGIYRSPDGGNTWTTVLGAPSGVASGTSVLFVGAGVAYAALGNIFTGNAAGGVYKSTDDGQTWTAVNGTGANVLPSGTAVGRISLAAAASNPLVLYAVVTSPTGFTGIYTTVDGGNNWTLTTAPNICTTQCSYDIAIAVSPKNPNIVYAGGIYTYQTNTTPGSPTTVIGSIDGGNTWTLVGSSTATGSTSGVHTDVHALTFSADASHLYVGSDGGAWKTSSFGNPAQLLWNSINSNLATAQFYPGFAYDGNADAIAGAQDNGSQVRDPASSNWSNVACGDGGFSAIDTTTTPYTFYTACTYSQGISATTTPFNVNSWMDVVTGINTMDPALFIPPMVQDPSTPSTLYYGTNQVYQTTNGGTSWASISPQPLPGSTGMVSAIAVAPSSSATIYAGTTDSQVVVTTNGGTNWTNMSTGLPPRYVSHISVNPTTPTTAYVTFSGFSGFGDTMGHVFQTTNGGGTWTDISGNLPNIPVNDIVIDPLVPNALYVATDIGVFATTNGGTAWASFGTGLPNVVVHSLVLEPDTRKLAAATHGRSAWRIDVGPASGLAAVTLAPPNLLFAPQLINTASAPQVTTLTVTAVTPLAITSVTSDNPDFAVTTTCPLAPLTITFGATCTFSVTYTPSRVGLYSTKIHVMGNLTGGEIKIPLRGTGTQDSITPTSLTFNLTPPQTTDMKSVTLNNVGTTPINITNISIVSDAQGEFSQTNNCGAMLAGGSNCTVTVTFTGTVTGTDTANLQINDDAAKGAPELVSLTGTEAPAP
jgi:photosystem II stability/assembly factor-like uncharacterized protein